MNNDQTEMRLDPKDISAIAIEVAQLLKSDIHNKDAKSGSKDRILNIDDVTTYLGCSKSWIYKNRNDLPVIQKGKKGDLKFRQSELDNWLQDNSNHTNN